MLDGSPGLRDDLVALLRHSPRDDYADTLVTMADRMAAHGALGPPSGDSELSAREQGVLRYLQTRLTHARDRGRAFHLDEHAQIPSQERLPQTGCVVPVRCRGPRQGGWSSLRRPEGRFLVFSGNLTGWSFLVSSSCSPCTSDCSRSSRLGPQTPAATLKLGRFLRIRRAFCGASRSERPKSVQSLGSVPEPLVNHPSRGDDPPATRSTY